MCTTNYFINWIPKIWILFIKIDGSRDFDKIYNKTNLQLLQGSKKLLELGGSHNVYGSWVLMLRMTTQETVTFCLTVFEAHGLQLE